MLIGFDASRAFITERTGTENYSYNILKELLQLDRKNAYKVYLRIPPELRRSKEAVSKWFENIKQDLPKTNNYRLVLLKNKRLWTQFGLALELFRRPVDVLFVPAHTLPVFRPKKMKTVVTIHDLGYEYLPQYHQFPQKLWLNRSTVYAINHANALIAVSEGTKEDLISKQSTKPEKIHVIYEGFNPLLYSPNSETRIKFVRNKYSIPYKYILFIGTIQPRKNIVRIIQAFEGLLKKEGLSGEYNNMQLLLIGKKGWLTEDIYTEAKKSAVTDRVRFLGRLNDEDTVSILSGASCFVFPSLFEGFGLPIIEAQACGVPVVTSNRKPMTEVGGEGSCEYVDPESVESITSGIEHVLSNTDYARSLIQKGFKNIQRFSWKKAAQQTLEVIESSRK